MKKKVVFNVPYNGDRELIDFYINLKEHILTVYGRAEDGYPQGRNTSRTRYISLDEIFLIAKKLNRNGLSFNYIINGNCHSNNEYDISYRRNFIEFVKKLQNNGIKTITVGNLFLIGLLKENIPEIKVNVSVISEIDCLSRFKQIEKCDIDYVCLSKTTYKNFNFLNELIRNKNSKTTPILLVNDPCLHHCSYTQYHNNVISHSSIAKNDIISYCRLFCTLNFLEHPSSIISASFIRPEDISLYQTLGYSIFKIVDRKQNSAWLKKVVKAYVEQSYDGNLAELMGPWNRHEGFYPYPKLLPSNLSYQQINDSRDFLRYTPIIINRELDGYLEHWKNINIEGCANLDCLRCSYCNNLAEAAIIIDNNKRDILINNIKIAIDRCYR